jgi:hypothetical protein
MPRSATLDALLRRPGEARGSGEDGEDECSVPSASVEMREWMRSVRPAKADL